MHYSMLIGGNVATITEGGPGHTVFLDPLLT
jgi:hypothetical protein